MCSKKPVAAGVTAQKEPIIEADAPLECGIFLHKINKEFYSISGQSTLQHFIILYKYFININYSNFLGRKIMALKDVTITLYKGCITVVLGTNGSGKSTLLSVITGLKIVQYLKMKFE